MDKLLLKGLSLSKLFYSSFSPCYFAKKLLQFNDCNIQKTARKKIPKKANEAQYSEHYCGAILS